jgi:hypothetical protein
LHRPRQVPSFARKSFGRAKGNPEDGDITGIEESKKTPGMKARRGVVGER